MRDGSACGRFDENKGPSSYDHLNRLVRERYNGAGRFYKWCKWDVFGDIRAIAREKVDEKPVRRC